MILKDDLPLRATALCASCGYHRFAVQVQRPERLLFIYHLLAPSGALIAIPTYY